jgi:thiol-disulfide isomerase/thioredoxin
MKKIITLIIFLVLLVFTISSCGKKTDPGFSEVITLDHDMILSQSQCSERNLEDKVLMIESEWCGHCATVKPLLKEISEEKNIEISFLDLGKDQEKVASYGVNVKYTPTVIINCQVIVGARSKEYYEALIENE